MPKKKVEINDFIEIMKSFLPKSMLYRTSKKNLFVGFLYRFDKRKKKK